jgi:hypothetical protein
MGVEDSDTGALFTAAQRLETHLTILTILGKTRQLNEQLATELADAIAETRRLLGRRNTVIHTQWNFGETSDTAQTYKIRPKDQGAREGFTATAIETIALEVNALLRKTLVLYPKLYYALRGRPPQPHSPA